MKYRRLGNTALRVSELCMGTMTFGSEFYNIASVNQPQANQMVETALDAGVNFFDTADMYSFGESETMLGQALNDLNVPRDQVVIATKVGSPMDPDGARGRYTSSTLNQAGLSRTHVMNACRDSLRRLDTDYIDLYQVHRWDPDTAIEEILRTLTDLIRRGYVRYIGCSNWSVRHLSRALECADRTDLERFVSLQPYYSLVGRDVEYELIPLCREQGLGVLPWSPLAGGFLTGKYRRDGEGEGRRIDFDFPPVDKQMGYDAVEQMDKIAKQRDCTLPQVALAWLKDRPGVTSIIVGARTLAQLEDNLGSTEVQLTDRERNILEEITRPEPTYPGWMIERTNKNLPGGSEITAK